MVDLKKYDMTQGDFEMLVSIKTGNAFNYLCSYGHSLSANQILDIAKEIAIEVDNYVERFKEPDVDSIIEELLQRWVDFKDIEEVTELINKEAEKRKKEEKEV